MFTLSEYRLFTVAMRYLFDDNTTTDNDGASPHKHQKLQSGIICAIQVVYFGVRTSVSFGRYYHLGDDD